MWSIGGASRTRTEKKWSNDHSWLWWHSACLYLYAFVCVAVRNEILSNRSLQDTMRSHQFPLRGSGAAPMSRSQEEDDNSLTLLDSIMPVLAWNLTVFNRARSFFSTLWIQKNNNCMIGNEHTPLLQGKCCNSVWACWQYYTFSCLVWPQFAHSPHGV